jgi:hypothetical protein
LTIEHPKTNLSGRIYIELLFAGSKSEGRYPVLHTEDGRAYRAHLKGKTPAEDLTLENFEGKEVTLYGVVDDLRGHWRITLDPADQNMVLLVPVETSIDQDSDLGLEAPAVGDQAVADIESDCAEHDGSTAASNMPTVERLEESGDNMPEGADE